MKKIYILGAMVCGLAACKPNIEPAAPERGDANFSSYVAVGSGYTAGITDGSYYLDGQLNSYPNILAQQFKSVGGGDFKQPLVSGQHGWPVGKLVLDYMQGDCDTMPRIDDRRFTGALDTVGTSNNIFSMGPFGNMGVPGTKVIDYLKPGYGATNIYAARMFKDPANSRPLAEILVPASSFFTVWLGVNDVLDYAMAGGNMPGNPNNTNVITAASAFDVAYDSVISSLTRNGAKGVVMNIPDILEMPYFRAIPPRSMVVDVIDANKLNLQYNSTQVHFGVGRNYYVIEDKNHPDGFRQIKENEIVRMDIPHDSIVCAGWGTYKPIPDTWVLTADEIDAIKLAINVFNNTIEKTARDYNVAVSDTRYFLNSVVEDGAQYNAADYTYEYIYGGIFSVDGIHFTGRGNALLANSLISTINDFYGSSIPYADVNKYEAIKLP